MKTDTYTITDAFAWDKQVLAVTLMKENNRSFIAFGADLSKVLDNPDLNYYSDAVKVAITAYAMKKNLVLDKTIRITMTVKTKDGVDHPFNMSMGRFVVTKDPDVVQQDLVKPAAISLAREASKEIPFADVESVSCYVEEVEEEKKNEEV